MTNLTAFTAILLLTSGAEVFGQSRYKTLVLNTRATAEPPGVATKEFEVLPFEAAELVGQSAMAGSEGLAVVKDGAESYAPRAGGSAAYEYRPFVVAGPARIRFTAPVHGVPVFVTFKIIPEAFPPDRTIIAMPGTNQTDISLECSTNLVQWLPATNGVYGPLPEAKFFRIKARVIN